MPAISNPQKSLGNGSNDVENNAAGARVPHNGVAMVFLLFFCIATTSLGMLGHGSQKVTVICTWLMMYALVLSGIEGAYRLRKEQDEPIPKWLAVLERIRHYLAHEDAGDVGP